LVNVNNNAVSGTIKVTARNSCGISAASSQIFVTVNPLPNKPGAIQSSHGTNICQGTSGILFSVPATTNATSYQWVVPGGLK
jgi:large repetitive protein